MRRICMICTLFLSCLFYYPASGMSIGEVAHTNFTTDTIYLNPITLIEDEARLICPELAGFTLPVIATNQGCETLMYGAVSPVSPNDGCITYSSGFDAGTDILCLEIRDANNTCVLFIYTINVMPSPLEAIDDFIEINEGGNELIRVMDNDIFSGNPQVSVIVPSGNANTSIVQDNMTGRDAISYTPNEGFCGADSLVYELCVAPSLCSRATVRIDVICEAADIKVYNGFSPNGDGINDFLVIEGLEGTVTDKIAIFNRWGNLVFTTNDYQNDWNGRWNGENLPDGTYFYVIDDGNGNESHGYIQLQR